MRTRNPDRKKSNPEADPKSRRPKNQAPKPARNPDDQKKSSPEAGQKSRRPKIQDPKPARNPDDQKNQVLELPNNPGGQKNQVPTPAFLRRLSAVCPPFVRRLSAGRFPLKTKGNGLIRRPPLRVYPRFIRVLSAFIRVYPRISVFSCFSSCYRCFRFLAVSGSVF